MGDEIDLHVRSQYESLKAASDAELSMRDELRAIEALSPDAWKKYDTTASVIADYIKLFDEGDPPPLEEWHRMLLEVGEDRRDFASKAYGHVAGEEGQAGHQLSGEKADLDKVVKALEDVQSAIRDGEEAHRLTEIIFKLKEYAEFAEKPSILKAAKIVRNKGSSEEHLVEQGLAKLADYGVDLTLVQHGFSSLEELKRRVETARHNVDETATRLQHYEHQEELAAKYKDDKPWA